MAVAATKKGLGRGLDALLGDAPKKRAPEPQAEQTSSGKREVPIEFLTRNDTQPRKVFSPEGINELAASIAARGILQPILVRPLEEDRYEIVAGERRWRAAQQAKLHKVPVIIRKLTDEQVAEIALIENVQRVDLNPVEEARAYKRLVEVFDRTQEQIAKAVGKSRSHVANIMRLLNLPESSLDALETGEISMGHARAILTAPDPDMVCRAVIKNGLSVRATEALVQEAARPKLSGERSSANDSAAAKPSAPKQKDADTRALEKDLAAMLGLEVDIAHAKKGAGSITVSYQTLEQLDDVCRRLMGSGV